MSNISNWYHESIIREAALRPAKRPIIPRPVKAVDYLAYTKLLMQGIQDEERLDEMLSTLVEIIRFIAKNTDLARNPHSGRPACPNCNPEENPEETSMTFFDLGEDIHDADHEGFMSQEEYDRLMKKHPDGFWICPGCNMVMDYKKTLNKTKDQQGNWMYTDQIHDLLYLLAQARFGDSFGNRNQAFQSILQFVHGIGSASHWFIEGGKTTLDKARQLGERPMRR